MRLGNNKNKDVLNDFWAKGNFWGKDISTTQEHESKLSSINGLCRLSIPSDPVCHPERDIASNGESRMKRLA
ncbi:hypothetical protein PRIPAC_71480 [Pristionchus pacificus]|uniref:Uncharacterized protein n=1 Tax=Pristionchus pacificus TaxID=54126 RepID=A0A2A6C523_PRIPA|nr:hypothetical protein PRIPAC_71480 [Pristionchus pacificus]|eukprot:PDM73239.1 hypothetical protein PRIPAC_40595 [Pristionchus pacificus]